ncbi:unnamed protein product [Adineta ricciae]|uniref:NAD(P)(+)--arginine ADP-ribosyltransferase n=1 Tax=Adineta ricciae TaxID=249248 RepID=A0A814RWT7_ADIRI|nr:unnamed protein product [Adineta ricciae]CAF1551080.1 unnamed protein product [Adineta ricciae]
MAIAVNINYRLLESVSGESKQMLLPISGYQNVTVTSLDDACQPIKDLFDEKLKDYIVMAKMKSTQPKDGLSPDESASIYLYTTEWNIHENSLYIVLNRTLLLADCTKLRPWFKFLKLFLTAFFKLPPSEHTLVWCGVREDLSGLYPKDKEFAWWAFKSCTASMSILETSNYLGKTGTGTIFSIQTSNGKDIRAHSYFDNENEILLPLGIYLKVVDNVSRPDGRHIIYLQEIPPPFKMLDDPFDRSQLKTMLSQSESLLNVFEALPEQENDIPTKPNFSKSKNKPPYSDKKLNCDGRACIKCGHCRDWYWRPDGNDKNYTKRDDATCTCDGYDRGFRFPSRHCCFGLNDNHRRNYHHFIYSITYFDGIDVIDNRLCQCDDNCS